MKTTANAPCPIKSFLAYSYLSATLNLSVMDWFDGRDFDDLTAKTSKSNSNKGKSVGKAVKSSKSKGVRKRK